MAIEIRELTIDDYEALLGLWEESGLPYRPKGRDRRAAIAHELSQDTSVFLAAEDDGTLVGAVLGTQDGRKGWINRLVVRPSHRRRGIGRTLVHALETRLQAMGIEIVGCLIEAWNESSMAFFAHLGYVHHPDIAYCSKRRSPET